MKALGYLYGAAFGVGLVVALDRLGHSSNAIGGLAAFLIALGASGLGFLIGMAASGWGQSKR